MLWRDMLMIGTAINLVCTFSGLFAYIVSGSVWIAVAMHFAPMPFNLFLFLAIWCVREKSWFASTIAVGWLGVMTLL